VIQSECLTLSITKSSSSQLWHKGWGHPSDKILQHLDFSLTGDFKSCEPCQLTKLHKLPFPEHTHKVFENFELVHSDVWANAPVNFKEGFKYFVAFIDDKSRATWLYLLKSKKKVFVIFQDFYTMVQNQFNTTIKTLRTDNGTEYVNHEFQTFLHYKGIIHQTSCVGTPQQNCVSKRKTRYLLEVTRALLFSANLSKTYWSDAILTACYLINHLSSHIFDFQSPMEILYNRKFNISHLQVFGCICYVHSQHAGKLDPHARKCVFIGYRSYKKGYKCYDPTSKRMYISRDVRFDETIIFYVTEN
jgi:Integrase core domain/GAG-pre-integrase domain